MDETIKRNKAKEVDPEEERGAEGAEVTGPSAEEGAEEELREEVAEVKEPVAEIPPEKAVPEEKPLPKGEFLAQCMQDPSFRKHVIHHIVKNLF